MINEMDTKSINHPIQHPTKEPATCPVTLLILCLSQIKSYEGQNDDTKFTHLFYLTSLTHPFLNFFIKILQNQ